MEAMKKLFFESNGKRWGVFDFPEPYIFHVHDGYLIIDTTTSGIANKIRKLHSDDRGFYKVTSNGIKLSEITEDQASEVVDSCILEINEIVGYNSIESLHSLIKSKGWNLYDNPESHPSDIEPTHRNHYDFLSSQWQEAESKTLYNPYLFKIKN